VCFFFLKSEHIYKVNIFCTTSEMSDAENESGEFVVESESEYDSAEETDDVEVSSSSGDDVITANYERLGKPVPPPPVPLTLLDLRLQYPEQRVR
jgi:hypothetical protein